MPRRPPSKQSFFKLKPVLSRTVKVIPTARRSPITMQKTVNIGKSFFCLFFAFAIDNHPSNSFLSYPRKETAYGFLHGTICVIRNFSFHILYYFFFSDCQVIRLFCTRSQVFLYIFATLTMKACPFRSKFKSYDFKGTVKTYVLTAPFIKNPHNRPVDP